jgi:proline racemase/trans-L-3-hydroxyproline dehydratase
MKLISTIDSHTAGEGTRLVVHGLPPLRGESMAAKLLDAQQRLPWVPPALLLEPRGHKDLYGAILTAPCHPQADFGVVFMDNQRYEPMCGHGLIGVVSSLLETGVFSPVEPETTLMVDTAVGLVMARARIEKGRVLGVAFDNVPAFACQLDCPLELPGGRRLSVDVAFGGNFFILVDARPLEVDLLPENTSFYADLGMRALAAANEQIAIAHPTQAHIDRILDVRFYVEPGTAGAHSRNLVVLGNRMVDRSPCGTGTCAELAVRYARGRLRIAEQLVVESILGTRFTAMATGEATEMAGLTPYPAIRPRVEGRAFLTGLHQIILDPDDPFPAGFMLPA